MRDNSRRGAPRSARAAGRAAAGRDPRGRGSGGRGIGQGGSGPGGAGPGGAGPGGAAARAAGHGARPGAAGAAEVARLTSLIEPVLRAMDVDLEAVRIAAAGRRRVLRITVDADGGVSLDEIAEVSREVSARIDGRNAMGDAPYTLEVSSPGVDRPLTQPRHWRRAAGRLVTVPLAGTDQDREQDQGAGLVRLEARIVGADDEGVALEIDGATRRFGYAELGPGRVQVEFGRLDAVGEADEDDDQDYFGQSGSAGDDAADEEDRNGH